MAKWSRLEPGIMRKESECKTPVSFYSVDEQRNAMWISAGKVKQEIIMDKINIIQI